MKEKIKKLGLYLCSWKFNIHLNIGFVLFHIIQMIMDFHIAYLVGSTFHLGFLSMICFYKWSGGNCSNEWQRKFIAESYYLYREIRHFDAVNRGVDNVYRSPTLTCADSGMPIVIEELEEKKV